MKKTASGIPTLCLIFAILCMTILALMSLSSARREEKMAAEALEQTRGYYEACSRSALVLEELEAFCARCLLSAQNEEAYQTALMELSDLRFPGDPASDSPALAAELLPITENGFTTFIIPFSDTQQLRCTVSLPYPQYPDDPLVQLIDLSSEPSGTWNPDLHQNVYQPD